MDKVIGMIDDMVALLKKEQGDDESKKESCEQQLDKTEDDLKILESTISDLEKSIEDTKEEIATLTDEIAALHQGIEDLDKAVKEATEVRKEEHEDYVTLMTNNGAAVELIKMAKNRMNKFYNPKMYKEPALVQVNLHLQDDDTEAPAPPPETWGAYSKKSEESNGVLAMMDSLVAELEKEIQEADFEEKDSQKEYETMMTESANKRRLDSKSITEKEGNKADAEANLQSAGEEKISKMKEAMATVDLLKELHADCDWLLQNFDVRREARNGEIDALKKAKAVLSGADYS
jgi:septal ring factor EnvC (AmiA/AmiB activator)